MRPIKIYGMILVTACVARSLHAQAPAGSDSLSTGAVSDSQRVLAVLKNALDKNPQDAAAWFRQGMVAWSLAVRAGAEPKIADLDVTRLRRLADTSLIIAAGMSSGDPQRLLDAGEVLRTASAMGPRAAGARYIEQAYNVTKANATPALKARAAIAMGRIAWLSHEVNANQMGRMRCVPANVNVIAPPGTVTCPDTPCYDLGPTVDSAAQRFGADGINRTTIMSNAAARTMHNQLIDCLARRAPPVLGDYQRAEKYFREAYSTMPTDHRAFRNLAMLLAERNRWGELAAVARDRTSRVTDDPWGWLTLGLALHRQRDPSSSPALERGVALMPPAQRAHLFAFSKLLDRLDSAAYVATDETSRAARERTFWQLTDPLWSRSGNDTRSEFLARVVYAELRWSVEELGLHGSESDRGEMYIRYGPPTAIATLRGCDYADLPDECRLDIERSIGQGQSTRTSRPGYASIVTFWDYDAEGIAFVFWGNPSYGTAHFPAVDGRHIGNIVSARPVSFDNIASERIVEIPTRLTRFRASADSVDVLVMLAAPVDAIKAASSTTALPRLDVWLAPRDTLIGRDVHDSATMRGSGTARFIHRLPPNEYFYRIEATADGSMTAARAMGWFTAGRDAVSGFTTHGFGLSDVLLATQIQTPASTPKRWNELSVAPMLRAIDRGAMLHLAWENYELASRNGNADYTIEVVLERERGTAEKIAAEVIGVIAKAVGVARDPNRVTYRFQRTTPVAAAIVDYLTLNLGTTPSGDYRLMVSVTDKISGRKTSTSSSFTIRE